VTLTHSADCHDPVCPQPHEERRCIFVGCVSTDRHWHGGFPGGYDNPDDPNGPPIQFTREPDGRVRDYNGAVLEQAPAIDRELLADAIFMHRLGQYQRSDALESSHLCFEDCAEDIAAYYGKAAR
jgi:hypothetical protein